MAENPRLLLERILLAEAAEIAAAREKSNIIHKTADIDAAGDEVEEAVRRVLRRKLGHNYYVGHGHIVDVDWKVSPQFDVIIADTSVVPSLFQSENGTEYFPFESVYAVGEIKSTYYRSKNYFAKFANDMCKLELLSREEVPANYIRTQSGGMYFGPSIETKDRHGKQNNLFRFMLCVAAGDFAIADVRSFFSSQPRTWLPNVVCLLDKGLITFAHFDDLGPEDMEIKRGKWSLLTTPERPVIAPGRKFAWNFYANNDGEQRALSWGILYGILVQHLMNTTLRAESPITYFQSLAKNPIHTLLTDPTDS